MTSIRSQLAKNRRTSPSTLKVFAVLCLILLALLTVVQVTHVHAVGTDADHCQLCIAIHSVVPLLVMVSALLLVRMRAAVPVLVEVRPLTRYWHPILFTRPPPSNR